MLRATRMLCVALWFALLLAPCVTIFSSSHAWDVAPLAQLTWTVWTFALLWYLGGRRWFPILTYPLALFGALAVGADLLRNVDLLELLLVTGAGSAHES